MISWLYEILIGYFCDHKYITTKEIEIHTEHQKLPVGTDYHLRCDKCGKLKQYKLRH